MISDQHGQLGRRCAVYLTLDFCSEDVAVCATQESLNKRLEDWPLLDYAARYWVDHFKRFEKASSRSAEEMFQPDFIHALALGFLKNHTHVQASVQITLFPDQVLEAVRKESQKDKRPIRTLILVKTPEKEEQERVDPFKDNGTTGLHLACLFSIRTLVPSLINDNAKRFLDASTANPFGMTPIHLASFSSDQDLVSILLNADADPGCQTSNGLAPLALAALLGHTLVVSTLRVRAQTRRTIDTRTASRLSPTEEPMALESGFRKDLDGVRILSQAKTYHAVTGRMALHYAAREGHTDILTLLLDAKANVTLQDSQGQTALHKAAKKRNLPALQLLIQSGANATGRVAEIPEPLISRILPTKLLQFCGMIFPTWCSGYAVSATIP
jgi:ankyrin repeat protein